MSIKTWEEVKDEIFGPIGEERRDKIEEEAQKFVKKLKQKLEKRT